MISKQAQTEFRSDLFKHLDGIVTAPSAYPLFEKGVSEYILEKKEVSLEVLTSIV